MACLELADVRATNASYVREPLLRRATVLPPDTDRALPVKHGIGDRDGHGLLIGAGLARS
jgi:hypothetical protein